MADEPNHDLALRMAELARTVAGLGVLSGVSFTLYMADRIAGALNLFSFKANAFDGESETFGTVLAAHAAAAILASREGEELTRTVTSTRRAEPPARAPGYAG